MKADLSVTDWRAGPAAVSPPETRGLDRDGVRLMVSHAHGHEHATFRDLPDFLAPGTLLVVNSSATLPASLPASARFGSFTLNLSTRYGDRLWLAEPRRSAALEGPVPLGIGETFEAAGLPARLLAPFPGIRQLFFVAFEGSVERAMADEGEPIRYDHVSPPYPPLAAYQTIFSDVPGSAEMPSAGRPFTEAVLRDLAPEGNRHGIDRASHRRIEPGGGGSRAFPRGVHGAGRDRPCGQRSAAGRTHRHRRRHDRGAGARVGL